MTAGGLVTSNDAALAVPDWPLSWGRLVPPLEGGIRYEFAHRVLAAAVAVLVGVQAFCIRGREKRPWMRRLAWSALAAVLAQAALGGALVKLVDPKFLAIAHASLGQLCFGLTVAIAAGYYGLVPGQARMAPREGAVIAIFLQTILGAAVRHNAIGLAAHIVGAIVVAGVVMWATMGIVIEHMDEGKIPRPAAILLGLTGIQIFSGLMAYTARSAAIDDPQPMPFTIWATVAHVVAGALLLGAAIVVAMKRPA